MEDKVYNILKGNKFAYFMVETTKYDGDVPMTYEIEIGGRMKGCMRITVDNIKHVPNILKDRLSKNALDTYCSRKRCAHISWIGYNPKCSIYQDLEKSMGTKEMVKVAVHAICKRYPWIDTFTLEDATEIRCDNDLIVSLFLLSIINNGKSYYQKHFGAKLKDISAQNQYAHCTTKMTSTQEKVSFSEFVFLIGIGNDTINKVEPIYNSTRTYREFFRKLRQEFKDEFCKFIYPWAYDFVSNHILQGKSFQSMTWEFSKSDVGDMEFAWQSNIDVEAIERLRQSFKKYYESQSGGHYMGEYGKTRI
jgi:hypothetical protein